jgi:hypothetical protein
MHFLLVLLLFVNHCNSSFLRHLEKELLDDYKHIDFETFRLQREKQDGNCDGNCDLPSIELPLDDDDELISDKEVKKRLKDVLHDEVKSILLSKTFNAVRGVYQVVQSELIPTVTWDIVDSCRRLSEKATHHYFEKNPSCTVRI